MLRTMTDFDELFRSFERDLSDLFGRAVARWPFLGWREGRLVPAIDVARTDGQLVIAAEMPGVDPNTVEATVEGVTLRIRGERRPAVEGDGAEYVRRELSYGTYERELDLPEGVDAEKIEARYEHGILRITVPVAQATAVKRIPVQVASAERRELKEAS
jgi:HSP20 family protein